MLGLCIEASHARGMGHFFRALNLATALRDAGKPVLFLINHHEACERRLQSQCFEFEVVDLEDLDTGWEASLISRRGIDLWVDDRLDTDARHAAWVLKAGIPRATFDDRGEGAASADLNIVALSFDPSEPVPGRRILRGPDYLILNPEIAGSRRLRHGEDQRVLVTMGGSDTWGITPHVIKVLRKARKAATVILGPGFRHEDEMGLEVNDSKLFTIKRDVPSLIAEFMDHGVAITAGGITPFEANAAGLPCIVIACEEFERPVALALERLGGSVYAGFREEFDAGLLTRNLPVETMSRAGLEHIRLDGVARILAELRSLQ